MYWSADKNIKFRKEDIFMKKENEKLQKINGSIQNVAGGEVEQNPLTDKWDVYDNKTGKRVAYDLTQEEANYIDFVYHHMEELEKKAREEKTIKLEKR